MHSLTMEDEAAVLVRYGENFGKNEYKLLEVDDGILQELFQSGLSIKGGENDEAVLCTSAKTYALKFVSTSNTVLLIPPREHRADEANKTYDVTATSGCHMELVEIAPRLEKLRDLVSRMPYTDDSSLEQPQDGTLFTWEELLDNTQASEEQLREGLKAVDAVLVGGFWRTMDPGYMKSLLDVVVLTAIQQDWNLEAFSLDEMAGVLEDDGYPAEVVRQSLSNFTTGSSSSSSLSALDVNKACVHCAKQLLSVCSRWKLDDFMQAWQQESPSGLKANIDMLKGEVLITRLGSDAWLHQFSTSSLPATPAERFSALFKERSRWDWKDLEPYLRDLQIPGLSVESMLLKYTRRIQPTAESQLVYTQR